MSNQQAFFRFIAGENCSMAVFYQATKYFSKATYEEKSAFYQNLCDILSLCLKELKKRQTEDIRVVAPIYKSYGIPDYYFQHFYKIYASHLTVSDKNINQQMPTVFDSDDKELASKLISYYRQYVESKFDYKEFCRIYNIPIYSFKSGMSAISDADLSFRVLSKYHHELTYYYQNHGFVYQELVSKINEGITINGVNRSFTLFDYFYYYGEYYLHQYQFSKLPLEPQEKVVLSQFFYPLDSAQILDEEEVMHFDYLKNRKVLKKKLVSASIKEEDAKEIIRLFSENNIPLYDVVVEEALRDYANGCLVEKNTLQRT